ncbi:hypothetical protein [Thalassotalea ganghwensis]
MNTFFKHFSKTVLLTSAIILPSLASAASNLTSLKVKDDIVYFTTDEQRTTVPSCMATDNASSWTVSLNTPTGNAIYALLVTASADNRQVTVEGADDCGDVIGFERATSVELGAASANASVGSSVEFIPTFFSGTIIVPSGVSGQIIELTPPEGQRVRLIGLMPFRTGRVANVEVKVGSNIVVDSLTLQRATYSNGHFNVSHSTDTTNGSIGSIPYVQGEIGEKILVSITSGTSGSQINYSYAFSY